MRGTVWGTGHASLLAVVWGALGAWPLTCGTVWGKGCSGGVAPHTWRCVGEGCSGGVALCGGRGTEALTGKGTAGGGEAQACSSAAGRICRASAPEKRGATEL